MGFRASRRRRAGAHRRGRRGGEPVRRRESKPCQERGRSRVRAPRRVSRLSWRAPVPGGRRYCCRRDRRNGSGLRSRLSPSQDSESTERQKARASWPRIRPRGVLFAAGIEGDGSNFLLADDAVDARGYVCGALESLSARVTESTCGCGPYRRPRPNPSCRNQSPEVSSCFSLSAFFFLVLQRL